MTGPEYGPYGPPPQQTGSPPPSSGQSISGVGGILALIGGVLLVLAFTVLNWFRNDRTAIVSSGSNSKFGKLHDTLDSATNQLRGSGVDSQVHFGVSKLYFGWLGWVLLIVAVAFALLAILPLGAATALFRTLGALVSLVALAITLWALDLVRFDDTLGRRIENLGAKAPSYLDFLKHTAFGAWATMLGFLLLGVAALAGPRAISNG